MLQELEKNFIFNEVIQDETRNTVRFVSPYYDPAEATVDIPEGEEPSPENAANILNIIASEPSISVEEVVTMKLKHIKRMAEKETEADIKDCVITVPPFWTYKERQALLDASEMAGLNVLGLINENTAGMYVCFTIIVKKFLKLSYSNTKYTKYTKTQKHISRSPIRFKS